MKLFRVIPVLILLVLIGGAVIGIAEVSAQASNYGLYETAQRAQLTGRTADDLPGTIGRIIFGVLSFIGVIFLVIVIYGGFMWMTAGGNTDQVKKAGTMIKNGAVGVLIILLSYGITLFIFTQLLGNGSSTSSTTTPPSSGACAPPNQCVNAGCCTGVVVGSCGVDDCCPPGNIITTGPGC